MAGNNGSSLRFLGRIFISGEVRAITGLHVGGSPGALAIGNVDQPVIRNVLNGQPYLPGSSIRGKMRSLAEKFNQLPQNQSIGSNVTVHVCQTTATYETCDVCQVFGVPSNMRGQSDYGGPTRLLVRDVALSERTVRELDSLPMDLPYTEVKWEAAIDRVTSAAVPRQQERVPAGAVFAPLDIVYSAYNAADLDRFTLVLQALVWIEDDYLGGQGSRGAGKVCFEALRVRLRSRASYESPEVWEPRDAPETAAEILARSGELRHWLGARLAAG